MATQAVVRGWILTLVQAQVVEHPLSGEETGVLPVRCPVQVGPCMVLCCELVDLGAGS